MRTAQKLTRASISGRHHGPITYMRTDSVNMAQEAVVAGAMIGQDGHKYVPDLPNTYRNKSKNAQEAHEAVRPTASAAGCRGAPVSR